MPDANLTLTSEEVARWAYRLFLGREAESDAVVAGWAALGTPAAIVEAILAVPEFAVRAAAGFPTDLDEATLSLSEGSVAAGLFGALPQHGGSLAALRLATLTSPVILERLPPAALLAARLMFLDRAFTLHGPARDAYWREVVRAGPDPGVVRVARVARALLPDGGHGAVGVDAGANLGLTMLGLAAAWPDHAALLGIEPDPDTAALLSGNLARNGLDRTEVLPVALGATEGRTSFRRQAGNAATSHMVIAGLPAERLWGEQLDVPVRRLDDVLAERALARLDLLKVDVEGAETLVLAGAADVLARYRPLVVIELNLWTQMVMAGRNPHSVMEEWAGLYPHMLALDGAGQPTPALGLEGRLHLLHGALMNGAGFTDLILCDTLDWLDRWN